MTLTTLHLPGSNPAAMTRSTTSLLVKIPAIFVPGAPPPETVDPTAELELLIPPTGPSMTQTAVVRRSFINLAASLTDVLALTMGGGMRVFITVVRSGRAILSLRASA